MPYLEDSDDEYDEEIEFDPDEKSKTRFNIVLCERYNVDIHGDPGDSYVKFHYLVKSRFKQLDICYISSYIEISNDEYIPIVYRNALLNLKPEIAECIDLETHERVAIIKTFWIKLIQRTWKNIMKQREDIIKKRCHPNSLRYREIYGKWPANCNYFPGLKGMLKT
jgi:hypothetical protein